MFSFISHKYGFLNDIANVAILIQDRRVKKSILMFHKPFPPFPTEFVDLVCPFFVFSSSVFLHVLSETDLSLWVFNDLAIGHVDPSFISIFLRALWNKMSTKRGLADAFYHL